MQSTSRLLKKSPSSSRWLQRQSQDPYVRLRTSANKDETYRSRSAFKLVSLYDRHPSLLGRNKIVADLGAAPGGWSQVAAYRGAKVIAVDLNHMDPIEGVDFVQGDFLDEGVRKQVEGLSGGKVDTVLSDMMASMTGVRDRDVQASLDLVSAATLFGIQNLKVGHEGDDVGVVNGRPTYAGGDMVLKFFMHPDLDDFRKSELVTRFRKVVVDKPKESRKESSEAYFESITLGFGSSAGYYDVGKPTFRALNLDNRTSLDLRAMSTAR